MDYQSDSSDSPRPERSRLANALIAAVSEVGAQMAKSGKVRDAEDAAQSAILALCEARIVGSYDHTKGDTRQFGVGVVSRIAKTQARGESRHRKCIDRHREQAAGWPAGTFANEGFRTAAKRELSCRVAAVLEQLPEDQAAEVRRRFFNVQPKGGRCTTTNQHRLWVKAKASLKTLLRKMEGDYFGGA